jgi:molybdenum cofactor cytidylyltransferase
MSQAPVVIVLAAGLGERFAASGGAVHKLDALLAGKRVIDHVLDVVRASGLPYHVVRPDAHQAAGAGMGDSIAAGVRATPDASGWLILPADLPLIRSDTLRAIASARPSGVTVPRYQGERGHPVRFDAACGPDLLKLKGNSGAAQVLRAQAAINSIAFVDLDDAGVVTDVDTLDDLRRAETLLRERSKAVGE